MKQALLDGPKLSRDVFVNEETTKSWTPTSMELMTLPVCLQFARTMGARSLTGRRLIAAEKQILQRQSRAAVVAASSRRPRSVSEASAASVASDGAGAGERGHTTSLTAARRSKRSDSLA